MTKSYHQPRKSPRRSWRRPLVLWVGLAVLVFCAGLLFGYFKTTRPSRKAPPAVAAVALPTREVILYFAADDGRTLVAENRQIDDCLGDEDCLRATVEALIGGSQSGLSPILPAQVALRGLTVSDSLVSVDFSQDLVSAHPGGTQSELLTIYGLADTLAVNFPHLRQVRILVEGAPAKTLKGMSTCASRLSRTSAWWKKGSRPPAR